MRKDGGLQWLDCDNYNALLTVHPECIHFEKRHGNNQYHIFLLSRKDMISASLLTAIMNCGKFGSGVFSLGKCVSIMRIIMIWCVTSKKMIVIAKKNNMSIECMVNDEIHCACVLKYKCSIYPHDIYESTMSCSPKFCLSSFPGVSLA